MKMGELHIVPPPRQALAILPSFRPLRGEAVSFPVASHSRPPDVHNTNQRGSAAHGITQARSRPPWVPHPASTLLNEQGFPPDVIELQLRPHERKQGPRRLQQNASGFPEPRNGCSMGRLSGRARAGGAVSSYQAPRIRGQRYDRQPSYNAPAEAGKSLAQPKISSREPACAISSVNMI